MTTPSLPILSAKDSKRRRHTGRKRKEGTKKDVTTIREKESLPLLIEFQTSLATNICTNYRKWHSTNDQMIWFQRECIQIVKFAKLINIHHNDISAILWEHISTVFHVRIAPLASVLASEMARHRQISLSLIQFGPGCSRRVHEPFHSLNQSQPPMNQY